VHVPSRQDLLQAALQLTRYSDPCPAQFWGLLSDFLVLLLGLFSLDYPDGRFTTAGDLTKRDRAHALLWIQIRVTVFYVDRDPIGPYCLLVPDRPDASFPF
jgi:hypothetical protein